MNDTEKMQQIHNFWKRIELKAATDKKFKEQLLSNPSGFLEQLGAKMPDGHQVKVLEETPPKNRIGYVDDNTIVLYLNPQVASNDMELNEEDLKQVAGGHYHVGGATVVGIVGSIGGAC